MSESIGSSPGVPVMSWVDAMISPYSREREIQNRSEFWHHIVWWQVWPAQKETFCTLCMENCTCVIQLSQWGRSTHSIEWQWQPRSRCSDLVNNQKINFCVTNQIVVYWERKGYLCVNNAVFLHIYFCKLKLGKLDNRHYQWKKKNFIQ